MTTHLILGTAGHIDHGKTALVRALTGTDTDRLPEEKKRGITIELGFAELQIDDLHLGIVDVPGHERFVRQMLAGATGMDLAMLVVAADDSVKPQTREHLDVLRLLDLKGGAIVLTKCDLADPAWIDLVEAEIRELVEGSCLAEVPIVRTSAVTGEGIDELRGVLATVARRVAADLAAPTDSDPFRLAIDRSFSVEGHGTVVTGSVSSGAVQVGEMLVIQPGGFEVRVRGLHRHDRSVERVGRGQRAAINLVGISHAQIRRGHELTSPGHLTPSRLLTVRLTVAATAPRPLKQRARLRVHVGTAEVMGVVSWMGQRTALEPGQSAFAQLYLAEPVAVVWNQPLVIRSESPVATIGGGRVLVPSAAKIRRLDTTAAQQLAQLADGAPAERTAAAIYFAPPHTWQPGDLARLAGVTDAETQIANLRQQGTLVPLPLSPRQTVFVHRQVVDDWQRRIVTELTRLHDRYPVKAMMDLPQLIQAVAYLGPAPLIDAVLRQMDASGTVRLSERGVGLTDRLPRLTLAQKQLMQTLIASLREAAFQPPTMKELQGMYPKQRQDVDKLIQLAVSEGELIHIADDIFLHAEVEQALQGKVRDALQAGGMTVSAIRELLGTTRKYAVPLCEYLDKIGITRRQGDLRLLADPSSSSGEPT